MTDYQMYCITRFIGVVLIFFGLFMFEPWLFLALLGAVVAVGANNAIETLSKKGHK